MIIGYVRVSTSGQELQNQKMEILEWANQEKVTIDRWVEKTMSSRRSTKDRGVDDLLRDLEKGDLLIVAELSRLGRSLSQVVQTVETLVSKGVGLLALKEGIRITKGKQDIASKTMVGMFGLLAEIERDLISERTKAGLSRARAEGKQLGRPKGVLGKSKLDGREEEIKEYLAKKVSLASMARILECSRSTLYSFIQSRQLR